MAFHIHFNKPDCPVNMGQLQKLSPEQTVEDFVDERKSYFPNVEITKDKLLFDVTEVDQDGEEVIRRGYGLITEIPDDFEN